MNDISFEILEGKQREPWTAFLYGVPGIGKSWLASKAPKALFADVEGGTGKLDVRRVVIKTHIDLFKFLGWAAKQDAETIVIDSATAVEKLLTAGVLADNGWPNLQKPGYGKGYDVLKSYWQKFLNGVAYLRDNGKNVIIVGHARVKPFADPLGEGYDRYEPDVDKSVSPLIAAAVDSVLFMRARTILKESEDEKRKIAIGEGAEVWTSPSPAQMSKNRFDLPPLIVIPRVREGETFTDNLWSLMK